jgi:hypothetical protein
LLALRRCRCRLGIAAQEHVTQVQVDMAFCGEVHVQVDQLRPVRWVADRQPGLLLGLPERCVPRGLPRIEVAAWLQPDTEPLVQVEDRAPLAAHNRRPCHVDEVGVAIEGVSQAVELGQETLPGRHLSRRRGVERGHRLAHSLRQGWVRPYDPVPPAGRRVISSTHPPGAG